ncbi:Short-chain dehydrogenase [Tistlia consotensis]|uniref:Short-chain dehydrogenase n=1 Tax=Tistlia consotensis USBA 355 TaxID=560819 RepID=A0A1Y6CLC3_9PROT|nr:SDR family NAD(P)-dependent oxidoreductase [Tistlia consotensis]SMF73470.1 Short-chain dehydrogenase [Tistlia consotensis USBA 355]SNS30303.1 Short-chain dehydrogenase [Tistlia consotensis]
MSPEGRRPGALVVTGGSSGIGRATALLAAARGWPVLASVRNEADAAGLEAAGCATARLDLRSEASIEAFAGAVLDWSDGRLAGLVNNAGTALPGPVERLDLDAAREQFEVNVFGAVGLTQRLLPALRSSRGAVVFVSSDRAPVAVPLYGAYVAAKRALEGFAEVLALEVADAGVGVSILRLGSFESAIRGPIRARLDALDGDDPEYAAPIARARASLGSPPLHPPGLAAEAILRLLLAPAPPLVACCPEPA